MIGSIISGAAGLIGGVIGGIGAGKARKKAQAALNAEKKANENVFNRDYYSDAMTRSDNASLMRNLRTLLDDQTKKTNASAAVTGATPELQAAQKAAANQTLANAAGNISALNSRYKDNVMNRYMNQRNNLSAQQQGIHQQAAQSWSNMMSNGLNLATQSAGAIGGDLLNGKGRLV